MIVTLFISGYQKFVMDIQMLRKLYAEQKHNNDADDGDANIFSMNSS